MNTDYLHFLYIVNCIEKFGESLKDEKYLLPHEDTYIVKIFRFDKMKDKPADPVGYGFFTLTTSSFIDDRREHVILPPLLHVKLFCNEEQVIELWITNSDLRMYATGITGTKDSWTDWTEGLEKFLEKVKQLIMESVIKHMKK